MNIKEVIHFYLGCDIQHTNKNGTFILKLVVVDMQSGSCTCTHQVVDKHPATWSYSLDDIKPIVRKLSDMTEKERGYAVSPMAYGLKSMTGDLQLLQAAHVTAYLLSRSFWLFGDEAFTEGLVIDKKTMG